MHDRSLKISTTARGAIRDASNGEHPGDLEVVRDFKWCVGLEEGDTIYSISLLAIDHRSRICKPDCPGSVDQSIMI